MTPTDARSDNQALPDELFQEELGNLVEVLKAGGWLFIFRNHVPRALFKDWAILVRGTQAHHSDYPISVDAKRLRSREQDISDHKDCVTIVIPKREEERLKTRPTPVSPRERITPPVDSRKSYEDIAADFYRKYRGTGALRGFDPQRTTGHELETGERERLGLSGSPLPVTNHLPDIWAAFTRGAIKTLAGTGTRLTERKS
ncbi:MAG TPA: hypothetical protein VJ714_06915, partial [Anaerolineae bacterium]|nr:hypothetical protein [Anaerolineae bacterium]